MFFFLGEIFLYVRMLILKFNLNNVYLKKKFSKGKIFVYFYNKLLDWKF